jgi:hypothetical protein
VPGSLTQRVGDHVLVSWASSQTHLFDAASEQRIG